MVIGTCGVYVAAPLARPLVAALKGSAPAEGRRPESQGALALKPVPSRVPEVVKPPVKPAAQELRAADAPRLLYMIIYTRAPVSTHANNRIAKLRAILSAAFSSGFSPSPSPLEGAITWYMVNAITRTMPSIAAIGGL